jgi:Ring finger domain
MYDMFFDVANSAASQFGSVMQDSRFLRQNSAQVHSEERVPPPNPQVKVPPASKKAIRDLAIVQVTADDLIEESNKECLICLDDQRIGSYACKLACGHLYHKTCLTEWLQKSCTCKFLKCNCDIGVVSKRCD